ncbi:MAG TPA: hypothetical protein VMS08_05335 [Candidatus Saccharimonadia bacterium]|nr:hypothetical protein [Candidatus Saccharimonadia bacterium]
MSNSISLASITSGSYDTYLNTFASDIAALNRPVMLTFDHEMNGSWYPWDATDGGVSTGVTPAIWIAAWNHVTTQIDSNAAAKALITWLWAPNIEQGGSAVGAFWTSSDTTVKNVGAVGLDGYYVNTGTTWANRFATSYTDVRTAAGSTLPFYVAETGIPPGDSNAATQEGNLVTGAESVKAAGVMQFDSGSYVMTAAMIKAWLADVN